MSHNPKDPKEIAAMAKMYGGPDEGVSERPADEHFDFLFFIGRFQPFHNGHDHVVRRALRMADKVVILVGSSNVSRSTKNPFSYEERRDMIAANYEEYVKDGSLIIQGLPDRLYDDDGWRVGVRHAVTDNVLHLGNRGGTTVLHGLNDFKYGLIGHEKDASSYYLNEFPDMKFVGVDRGRFPYGATDIRREFFKPIPYMSARCLSPETIRHMNRFSYTDACTILTAEFQAILSDLGGVYPRNDVTADAVVTAGDHEAVLLVRRRGPVGAGLLALPGGYVNPTETLLQAAVRELNEETGLRLEPDTVLASKTFDDPGRSLRRRVITTAFRFHMPLSVPVDGADDAADAGWFDPSLLEPEQMFEDHYWILQKMLKS